MIVLNVPPLFILMAFPVPLAQQTVKVVQKPLLIVHPVLLIKCYLMDAERIALQVIINTYPLILYGAIINVRFVKVIA